jgi:hypothetical protein
MVAEFNAYKDKLPKRTLEMKTKNFQQVPLRAHSLLADVPLYTLERVALPGGRPGMTMAEISEVIGFSGEVEMKVGPITQMLFDLRGLIGRVLHWDDAPALVTDVTFLPRLSEADRARSLVLPGKEAGISRILYQFPQEMLGEIINRTVHCFWVLASEPMAQGYILWVAVYVRQLNWFTPVYMTLISPILKWIIYPALLKGIKRRWEQAFPVQEDKIINRLRLT